MHRCSIVWHAAATADRRVLQGEDELAADPFSCDAVAADAGCARGGGAALSLADLDARLSDFAVEHIWDASGSLCDFGCAASDPTNLGACLNRIALKGPVSACQMLRHTERC